MYLLNGYGSGDCVQGGEVAERGEGEPAVSLVAPGMLPSLFSRPSSAGDFGPLTTVSDHRPLFFRDDKTEMHVFLMVFGNVKMDQKDISGHIKRAEKRPSRGQA